MASVDELLEEVGIALLVVWHDQQGFTQGVHHVADRQASWVYSTSTYLLSVGFFTLLIQWT